MNRHCCSMIIIIYDCKLSARYIDTIVFRVRCGDACRVQFLCPHESFSGAILQTKSLLLNCVVLGALQSIWRMAFSIVPPVPIHHSPFAPNEKFASKQTDRKPSFKCQMHKQWQSLYRSAHSPMIIMSGAHTHAQNKNINCYFILLNARRVWKINLFSKWAFVCNSLCSSSIKQ